MCSESKLTTRMQRARRSSTTRCHSSSTYRTSSRREPSRATFTSTFTTRTRPHRSTGGSSPRTATRAMRTFLSRSRRYPQTLSKSYTCLQEVQRPRATLTRPWSLNSTTNTAAVRTARAGSPAGRVSTSWRSMRTGTVGSRARPVSSAPPGQTYQFPSTLAANLLSKWGGPHRNPRSRRGRTWHPISYRTRPPSSTGITRPFRAALCTFRPTPTRFSSPPTTMLLACHPERLLRDSL